MNDDERYKTEPFPRMWGFDTGAILFTPHGKDECSAVHIQDYPELFDKVIALCDQYFKDNPQ